MSRMVIYLGCLLPGTSSNLPKADGPPYALFRSCFGWGLHRLSRHRESGSLLHCLSALTTINVAVSFLLHFPWSHLHRTLSGILPYEARTFLPEMGRPFIPLYFILFAILLLTCEIIRIAPRYALSQSYGHSHSALSCCMLMSVTVSRSTTILCKHRS